MHSVEAIARGLRRRYYQRDFNNHCRAVLNTRPVKPDVSSGLVVLSQSYHNDLLMYLVAAKTFAHYVAPSKFVIVDDGFTDNDRDIIQWHLGIVDFISRNKVSSTLCPSGGCWERLLTIADLCQYHYVIQLDSDTVTIAKPIDVIDYIQTATSFTLSTKLGRTFLSTIQAAESIEASSSKHVQVLSEKALNNIEAVAEDQYIRGCAGFAGFAKKSINRDSVERISSLMMEALGTDVWNQWGSEQFASNYLIANAPKRGLLAFESYPYWEMKADVTQARLIHFIGDNRFTSRAYRELAVKALQML